MAEERGLEVRADLMRGQCQEKKIKSVIRIHSLFSLIYKKKEPCKWRVHHLQTIRFTHTKIFFPFNMKEKKKSGVL